MKSRLHQLSAACDLFRPVWERTEARDSYVSIEVEPNLAAGGDPSRVHSVASRGVGQW